MTVLACDMGGRRIKLGVVRDGAAVAVSVLPAHAEQSLLDRLEAVAEALEGLCRREGIAVQGCAGIGLSYPSVVDSASAAFWITSGSLATRQTLTCAAGHGGGLGCRWPSTMMPEWRLSGNGVTARGGDARMW